MTSFSPADLCDQNAPMTMMQTYLPDTASWLTLKPPCTGNYPSGKEWLGWFAHIPAEGPKQIDLYLPNVGPLSGFDPKTDLFPGLNLLNFYSFSMIIDIEYQQLSWPRDLFEIVNQNTEKEATAIMRYDNKNGKWLAKYQFFNQPCGPESQIKKEGYAVYLH